MLKIGEFSKLSKVSVRMLRHYDEIGLLKPISIDRFTGYRYYSEEQLPVMLRINSLKKMGFGLSAIGEILKRYDDRDELERYFIIRHTELKADMEEISRRMVMLETALKELRKDDIMNFEVTIKTMPERKVASVRRLIPTYKDEGLLWNILFKETEGMNMKLVQPIFLGAVLHDTEHKESDVDVEVQAAVEGDYTNTENVIFKIQPETLAASVTFTGPYEQFGKAYAAIASWINRNGYAFNGPIMDIYHRGYYETDDQNEFLTEVCCPVRKIR